MLLVRQLELLTGRKVDLELQRGERYVLQGPNGSGKTVLLRTLAGLYSAPFSEFSFDGKSLNDWNMEEYRSRVLYSGTATHLPGDMTAEEFLAAPSKLAVYKDLKGALDPKEYLSRWKVSGKSLGHLSSGQKQLLIILRALSLRAELLLLDEPTSHMDPDKTKEVEGMINSWLTPERSYLMISHSDAQAERMGKKIPFESL